MNLKALSKDKPTWREIQEITLGDAQVMDHLLRIIQHYAEAPEDEMEDLDDMPVIHGIRILADREDLRIIPSLIKIMARFDEDCLLKVVDQCQTALDSLARPEVLPTLWKAYDDHQGSKTGGTILRAIAKCGASNARLHDELLSYFEEEPVMASWAMADTLDPSFLPALEEQLRRIAPMVKYLPFERSIPEHDEWIELGAAWLTLKRVQEKGRDAVAEERKRKKFPLKNYYERKILPSREKLEESFRETNQEVQREQAEIATYFLDPLPDKIEQAKLDRATRMEIEGYQETLREEERKRLLKGDKKVGPERALPLRERKEVQTMLPGQGKHAPPVSPRQKSHGRGHGESPSRSRRKELRLDRGGQ